MEPTHKTMLSGSQTRRWSQTGQPTFTSTIKAGEDHEQADAQDDEGNGGVAAVLATEIEPAGGTGRGHVEKTLKQAALPAARAAAGEAEPDRRPQDPATGAVVKARLPPHQYTQTKRNSQTTSTKCQYQVAASNPTCFSGRKTP